MKFTFRTAAGKNYFLDIDYDDSVIVVKHRFAEQRRMDKKNVDPDNIDFIFRGHFLDDGIKFRFLDYDQTSVIYVREKSIGDQNIKIKTNEEKIQEKYITLNTLTGMGYDKKDIEMAMKKGFNDIISIIDYIDNNQRDAFPKKKTMDTNPNKSPNVKPKQQPIFKPPSLNFLNPEFNPPPEYLDSNPYTQLIGNSNKNAQSTFMPFDNEFQEMNYINQDNMVLDNDEDQKLEEKMAQMREFTGGGFSDDFLRNKLIENNMDINLTLDAIFS